MKQTTATVTCDGCGFEFTEWYTRQVDASRVREDLDMAGWTTKLKTFQVEDMEYQSILDYCPKCKEAHQ